MARFGAVTGSSLEATVGHIEEVRLPGIGKRVEFSTGEGRRMGVVQHHGGRREVFVCRPGDPDNAAATINLTEDDAHSLVDALGVVTVAETDERTYEVEGLVFEWIDVLAGSPVAGRSIARLEVRTQTGASVVAIMRPSGSVPAPDPGFVVEVGDTVVVAGTSEGVEAVAAMIAPR